MTNNEAIKMLRTIKRTVLLGNRKFEDAIDVAISALEGKNINVHSNNQIDRKAAIDAIDRFNVCGAVEEDWVTLRDALQALPSVQSEQRWIPWDSGKFPEESGTYTVTAYDGATMRVTYAKYQKRLKRWELTGARAYWRVLAWMPLPKPYKEGD